MHQRLYKALLFFPLICLVSISQGFSKLRAESLKVGLSEEENVRVGPYLFLYEDKTGELSLEDFLKIPLSDLQRFDKPTPHFGYSKSVFWARFSIENLSSQQKSYILNYSFPGVDYLSFFRQAEDGTWIREMRGDRLEKREQTSSSQTPLFKIQVSPGQSTYALRIETKGSLQFPLELMTPDTYTTQSQRFLVVITLLIGGTLSLLIYNFFIFTKFPTTYLFLYILYLSTQILFNAGLQGFWNLLPIPDRFLPSLMNPIYLISGVITTTAAIAMTCSIFDIKSRANSIALGLQSFVTLFLCVYLFFDFNAASRIASAFNLLTLVWILSVSVTMAIKKHPFGRIYLFAWVFMLSGTAITVLGLAGRIPPFPFSSAGSLIGSFVEGTLIALVIGGKIRAELRKAQDLIFKKQEEALAEQQRSNQELQKIDRMKDDFLANTSHELRTPLHAIIGLTEAMVRDPKSPQVEHKLSLVLSSAKRLASLVNDILDFSKLRHESIELRNQKIDLSALTEMILTLLEPLKGQKDITLERHIDPAIRFIRGDENRLQQILLNLLGNAVKFTLQGRVCLVLDTAPGGVRIRVSDTGIGIPADKLDKIFESFVQADGSSAREFGGTGLGLAITKKLIELHGGSITVSSEVGKGTEFTVILPLRKDVSDDSPEPTPTRALKPEPIVQRHLTPSEKPAEVLRHTASGNGVRLLIADDDPINLEVLKSHLEPEGFTITTASDGKKALEILQNESFDLALFDVMMPQLTGYDLTRKIREEIDYSELPILLLTAKSQPSDVQFGFECGASDYLVKPFARQELLARIGTHQRVHLQGLALKQATKDLQNEIKAKTFLVQDLLHRGNNPLHACQLQLETLALTKKSLESILLSLFNHGSGLDEEAQKCLMQITRDLAQLEESVRFAHLQTHRISGALEEIRSLSGIDGITSQDITLKDLMDSTLDRLKEQLPQHTFALLKVEWAIDPTLKIPGHPTVFPVILERFIRQILLEAPSSLTLTWILKQEIPHLQMSLGDSREPWRPSLQSEELLSHISYCLRSLGFELTQTEQPHILRLAA